MPTVWTGIPELERKFKTLETLTKLAVLKSAIRKGAKVIRDEAESRAPRRTGELAEGMTTRMKDSDLNSLHIDIGPSKDEFYGFFQEFGTAFMPAQPFLKPAFEAKQAQAQKAIEDGLKAAIEKALK